MDVFILYFKSNYYICTLKLFEITNNIQSFIKSYAAVYSYLSVRILVLVEVSKVLLFTRVIMCGYFTVAETSSSQHTTTIKTDKHPRPGGIRIRNLSKRASERPPNYAVDCEAIGISGVLYGINYRDKTDV